MRPDERDAAFLGDMLRLANEVAEYARGVTAYEYLADQRLRRSIERVIGIIGEAARNVSSEFQAEHHEIDWRGIVGLRNLLAHEYGHVIDSRIWTVVVEEIPRLIRTLEELVMDAHP